MHTITLNYMYYKIPRFQYILFVCFQTLFEYIYISFLIFLFIYLFIYLFIFFFFGGGCPTVNIHRRSTVL